MSLCEVTSLSLTDKSIQRYFPCTIFIFQSSTTFLLNGSLVSEECILLLYYILNLSSSEPLFLHITSVYLGGPAFVPTTSSACSLW